MSNKSHNRPGIVGAAIVPHAPQFLTLPETEDKAQVGRVNQAMRSIGDKFRALDPDLLIVLSNAHCDDFVVHCVPAFMIHCGRRAEGSGGHRGGWPIDGEAGYALLRQLLDLGFDPAFTLDARLGTAFTIPLDFCGYPRETPFLPIFVNAYVPPSRPRSAASPSAGGWRMRSSGPGIAPSCWPAADCRITRGRRNTRIPTSTPTGSSSSGSRPAICATC